jgi:hypothetical protein
MIGNLAKAPLLAIFFAALTLIAGTYIPWSVEYQELSTQFTEPTIGPLYTLLFCLWFALIYAISFGDTEKIGLRPVLLLSISVFGGAFILPILESLLFGAANGVLSRGDARASSGFGAACAVLALALILLVYKPKPPGAPVYEKYKLNIIPLAIKAVVLPLVFTLFYFTARYFLLWSGEEARVFYSGNPENAGFVGSIVNILLDDAWMLSLALARGLGYTLFALPLLFLYQGKRVMMIVLNCMCLLFGPIRLLAPSPIFPDSVRISVFIFEAVLLAVFGAFSAFLLHTSVKKEAVEPPPAPSAPRKLTPQQQAILRARKAAAAGGTAAPPPAAK